MMHGHGYNSKQQMGASAPCPCKAAAMAGSPLRIPKPSATMVLGTIGLVAAVLGAIKLLEDDT